MKSKLKRISKAVLIFYSTALLLTSFQNCGGIHITPIGGPPEPIVVASTKSDPTYLKPPTQKVQISRLVVFMDMSQSMVSQYCDHDISSPPENSPAMCYLSKSSDPDLWRLKNLRQWLVKLQTELPAAALAETKVLIVPFTGGLAELKRDEPTVDGVMAFDTITNAISTVDRLMAEQTQTKNNIQSADPGVVVESVMGTSIPGQRLEVLKSRVKTEIDNLSAAGLSGYVNFQVLVFSDGEPVPTVKNVKDTIDRVWAVKEDAFRIGGGVFGYNSCRSLCAGVVQNWINNNFDNIPPVLCVDNLGRRGLPEYCQVCKPTDNYSYCTGGTTLPNSTCPAHCVAALDAYNQTGLMADTGFISGAKNTLLNDIKVSWGHFESNTPSKIVRSINGLRAIFAENSEVQFQVQFFKIDKFKLTNPPPPPATPEITNWLDLAKASFTKNATHEVITSENMDKTLFKSLQSSSSYKIKNFFVFNLNARVDKFADFQIDSDSDGLFDYEDQSPTNARSNGVCLDSIAKRYGCMVLSCDANLDIDGDNLNECEERTIGSDSYDFDTDNDGLSDSIEILYDSNFKKYSMNENSNPQADSISDYKSVFFGLHPLADWDEVEDTKRTSFYYEMTDPKDFPTESGTTIQSWGYVAQIKRFPGAVKKSASVNFPMYVSKAHNSLNQHTFNILDSNASDNQNTMLILVSLVSVANPNEIFWFALNKPVNFGSSDPIELDLGDLTQIRAKDPQGVMK